MIMLRIIMKKCNLLIDKCILKSTFKFNSKSKKMRLTIHKNKYLKTIEGLDIKNI